MSEWQDISEPTKEDYCAHLRGLWVTDRTTGYKYWDAIAGHLDDETGEFKTLSGDDCGWSAEDFSHRMPLPDPPPEDE